MIIFFSFPFFSFASSRYDVETMLVDASILENGDMHVKELIVVNGNFTSFEKDLTYKNSNWEYHTPNELFDDAIYNGTGLKDVTIQAKKGIDEVTFDSFEEEYTSITKTYYREDAQNLEYVESSIQDGKTYTIFYESTNETVAFMLEYTITDVVVLHEDIAEIYWPFLRNTFDNTIMKFCVKIHFPKALDSNDSHNYIHGDITGNIEQIDEKTVLATFTKLSSNTSITIRSTFQTSMVQNIILKKQTNTQALQKIVTKENCRVEEDLAEYQRINKIKTFVQNFCILYVLCLFIWWVFVLIRYQLPYHIKENPKYNPEIPKEYSIEVSSVLLYNRVSYDAFCASLLSLIARGIVLVKPGKNDNYELSYYETQRLTYTEELLVDFLFEKIGSNKSVTLDAIENYVTGEKSSLVFANFYSNWRRCVLKEADRQHFYEKNGLPIITSIFALLIIIFVLFASVYFRLNILLPWICFIITILFCIYCWMIKKRTKKGQIDYMKFQALSQYLMDFDSHFKQSLPKTVEFPIYFAYASLFGITDQVYEQMRKKTKGKKIDTQITRMNTLNQKVKYAMMLNQEMVYEKKT